MPRTKKRIGTIDSETDPFKHGDKVYPFTWGFYDGDNYVDFWGEGDSREEQAESCCKQLIDYLETEDPIILYAHNGGKFDFLYLLKYLDEDMMIINGRIAKATLFDGKIELRDSMMILPMPLKDMDKEEFDYTKNVLIVREKHKDEILRYQRSDCVYLHDWVSRFIDQFGNNLTLAGTAFKELKKTTYQIGRTYEEYDDTFRSFYYGGRVQCFDVGHFSGDFLYIDINSAYPYAMKDKHWYGSQYIEGTTLPEKDNGSWFADIDAISYGALPYRGEDNKLYFPNDGIARRYRVTGWEIKAGIETATLKIIKVHKSYRPLFTNDFSEYVDFFFAMKQKAKKEGDIKLYILAKLFLNSCYGKFGQDGRKFEKFAICEFGELPEPIKRIKGESNEDYSERNWTPYSDTVTGHRMYSRPDPQNSFFNVATAASVTGFVRAYLWRAICEADTPLYCDTDSLICKGFAGNIGTELGAWDIEALPKEVYIAQRKMYAMRMANYSEFGPVDKTKVASKGVRLDFDEIKRGVLTGENITFYKDAPSFSLKHGQRFIPREVDFENIHKNLRTNPPTTEELIKEMNVSHLMG